VRSTGPDPGDGSVVREGSMPSSRARSHWWQRGRSKGTYRGHDRRGVVAAEETSPGPVFVVAGLGLLGLMLFVIVGRTAPLELDPSTAPVLVAQLDAGGFAVALLVAALCFVRWRLVGEAAVLWLGSAAATFAAFALGHGYVQAISEVTGNAGLLWLQPASRLVVIGLVVCALLSPEVDATLRPSRIVGGAVAVIAISTLLLQLLPEAGVIVATSSDAIVTPGDAARIGSTALVGIWLGLAVWSLWVGLHSRHIFAWFGLLFFALAFERLFSLIPAEPGFLGVVGPPLLRVYGLLCAVLGATNELARAYVKQGTKLLESVTSERSSAARIQVELASQAERAHETANALASIEGATITLQRYQDQLEPAARDRLTYAVSAEIQRLQQLVSISPRPATSGRFRPLEAFAAVITCTRWEGATVTVDIPGHLVALGQPAETTQVLQNLLHNASRYAGGQIVVRGSLQDDRVIIRVEDEGPGIALDERESIFTRGVRGRSSGNQPGSGLGLYISSRLMHQQGGDIHVEASPSGGACFVVSLPGFSELATDDGVLEQSLDQADEVDELALESHRSVLLFPHHRQRRTRGIEDEDGFRDDVAR
jgi:signal transduction histidine kinase